MQSFIAGLKAKMFNVTIKCLDKVNTIQNTVLKRVEEKERKKRRDIEKNKASFCTLNKFSVPTFISELKTKMFILSIKRLENKANYP